LQREGLDKQAIHSSSRHSFSSHARWSKTRCHLQRGDVCLAGSSLPEASSLLSAQGASEGFGGSCSLHISPSCSLRCFQALILCSYRCPLRWHSKEDASARSMHSMKRNASPVRFMSQHSCSQLVAQLWRGPALANQTEVQPTTELRDCRVRRMAVLTSVVRLPWISWRALLAALSSSWALAVSSTQLQAHRTAFDASSISNTLSRCSGYRSTHQQRPACRCAAHCSSYFSAHTGSDIWARLQQLQDLPRYLQSWMRACHEAIGIRLPHQNAAAPGVWHSTHHLSTTYTPSRATLLGTHRESPVASATTWDTGLMPDPGPAPEASRTISNSQAGCNFD
jgi:hypothetical protein